MGDYINNIYSFFAGESSINYYIIALVKIIFIILIGKIAISVLNRVINKFFKISPKFKMDERKSNTLMGILKSVVKYIVYLIMGISILNVLGIPTESIIAAAGLGGVAIGFGAQSLVRDVFTGFFILFEDQYSVGDYITIGTMTGTVEEIGLRITKLRAFNGDLHIIPNGEVKMVTNHSRGDSLAVLDIGISFDADEEKAINILEDIAEQYYYNNGDKLVEKPQILGIVRLSDLEVVIRMIGKTKPLKHWEVEREIRMLVKKEFEKEGIELSYPKKIIINKPE